MNINTPKISVLILSFNGKNLLNESVGSYLNNNYKNFKVIVIDNGSTDGTKKWVESKWKNVKVLRTDVNLKYSGGLNFGLKYAFNDEKSDYALITNNDVKADVNLISELVKVAETNYNIGFIIGKVYYYDYPEVLQTVGKKFDKVLWNGGHIGNREKDEGQYDKIAERDWCDDIYMLVRKEVWDITGGYDTEFAFQGEDFEWEVRAKMLGYKIMFTPYAKLWHKESMTIGKTSSFKAYYDARNPLIIHMKHRTREQFKAFYKIRLKSLIESTVKSLIKLKWGIAFANVRGLSSAFIWAVKNKKWRYFF